MKTIRHRGMAKTFRASVCMLMMLIAGISSLIAVEFHQQADEIAAGILPYIDLSAPLFLDLRCGEWNQAISQALSTKLLGKSADIREVNDGTGFDELHLENISLKSYGIETATLVQIEMNYKWQTVEHKSFFSYRSERKPLYSFSIKQISLPGYRLAKLDNYDYSPSGNGEKISGSTRFRWFEPLIATTALASIIFLLWTME
ncbi:MAG TPA: hypothetical protein PL188_05630 [Candidatus Cloacimonadota bacterium]|nr:hypothetical protein [Candidatus Cloacimonadota bacterium]